MTIFILPGVVEVALGAVLESGGIFQIYTLKSSEPDTTYCKVGKKIL